jgi:predicted transcriptional regulator
VTFPKKKVEELIPIHRNILGIVNEEPGISKRGIAEKMKISYQLVHYHIKVLQESEYLFLKKDKKQSYCYDAEELLKGEEAAEAKDFILLPSFPYALAVLFL